jgi:hypothetical protein
MLGYLSVSGTLRDRPEVVGTSSSVAARASGLDEEHVLLDAAVIETRSSP